MCTLRLLQLQMQRLYIPLNFFYSFNDFFFKYTLTLLEILVIRILTKQFSAMVDFLLAEVVFLSEGLNFLI
jgi:hypothetical protein